VISGSSALSGTNTVPPLALETNSILSHQLTYVDFLVPGILAMALMQLGLFGTATPLVTLRQEQVLRRLGATPLPRWHLLASQVLMRLTIALVQTGLILALSVWVFKVEIQGNILAVLGFVVLGAVAFVSLGYLVAAISKTVDAANGITSAVNFPMMFLSGIFFPLAALPLFLTPIVRALPLTYLGDALRQIMMGGTPAFPRDGARLGADPCLRFIAVALNQADSLRRPDLNHGHLIPGQGSGLVGADERRGPQGLDRFQPPHQGLAMRHPLRTHGQRQRHRRQQPFGHESYGDADREKEPILQ